jgi:N-acetylglucosamine-6-sulfatase
MVAAWLGGAVMPSPAADTRPRPNIVVVVVDDLRWDELGVAGHPFVKTPHIDRIAREGARFTNAFAHHAALLASRASLLTGLYARTHGIVDNTDRSPRSHELATFRVRCSPPATRRPSSASGTWASTIHAARGSTTGSA